MQYVDPLLQRIETYNAAQGGGVLIRQVKKGYSLFLEEDGTPLAQLRPTGDDDEVEVLWWSHRGRWEHIGDFGGEIRPLDEALNFIVDDPFRMVVSGFDVVFGSK